jgi:glutamate N-acetyltransferase/amino-acid N-acetyltransferase
MDFPRGFHITGLESEDNNHFGLIYAPRGMRVAGVFTVNTCPAHPVIICRERMGNPSFKAILVNKGSANAATGPAGRSIHENILKRFADELKIDPVSILPASTGVIGNNIEYSGEQLAELAANSGERDVKSFAEAIMTTDTVPTISFREFEAGGKRVRLTGIAKGAGMISPNMATMLAFIVTDAAINAPDMYDILKNSADRSFNRLSVDGDMSTNDTVFFASSLEPGALEIDRGTQEYKKFAELVEDLCRELAVKIASDGEGATKLVKIEVSGLKDDITAETAARAVANSPLCKTALFGESPNWGRIVSAIGASGVSFRLDDLVISLNGTEWITSGRPVDENDAELRAELKKKNLDISIVLGTGSGSAEMYTCDFGPEYVTINAGYLS